MTALRREPLADRRCWFHRWERVDGLVDFFGVVRQCRRCNLVEVDNVLMDERVRGPHTMLRDNNDERETSGG